ncbi:hypothetical protein [Streptomyces sp. NBC_01304]|uniref:hypothetical protein n=1 Tax=Streptomyces sp. NBC_01304 TaxID=2903818 RepID=UPI002E15D6B7|nr:hypothetical protein OG430_23915 [Streptomyces sp. NBC_01304]
MAIDLKKIQEDVAELKEEVKDSQRSIQKFQEKFEHGRAKGEVVGAAGVATGASGEVTGASFGLKLFNAEHTFFDAQEMYDKYKRRSPEQLKLRLDELAPHVFRLRSLQVPQVRELAGRAHERISLLQPRVRDVESSLRAMRNRVSNNVPAARSASTSNLGSFSDAATHINRLEQRINRLVSAIG